MLSRTCGSQQPISTPPSPGSGCSSSAGHQSWAAGRILGPHFRALSEDSPHLACAMGTWQCPPTCHLGAVAKSIRCCLSRGAKEGGWLGLGPARAARLVSSCHPPAALGFLLLFALLSACTRAPVLVACCASGVKFPCGQLSPCDVRRFCQGV